MDCHGDTGGSIILSGPVPICMIDLRRPDMKEEVRVKMTRKLLAD